MLLDYQCIWSRSCLHWIQSFWFRPFSGQSPPPLNRIFTKQIRNSNNCKYKRNYLWSFSPTSELRIISQRHIGRRGEHVNSRPTTVACRSHSAFSFVLSTMTTGCDATRRAFLWCQPRLVKGEGHFKIR